MVWIPGANVRLGKQGDPINPLRQVLVGEFCIDLDEMTAGRYQKCVAASKCPAAGGQACQPVSGTSAEDYPITCIDQQAAAQACAFDGKRLVTQEEWELAARGPSLKTTAVGGLDRHFTIAQARRHFVLGRIQKFNEDLYDIATTGVHGMAGNVSEWTASTLTPATGGGPQAVVRGGSFVSGFTEFGADATTFDVRAARPFVGARCAFTPKGSD